MSSLFVLILAAGQGTRMKSRRAKVLHEIAGRSLIEHVCRTAARLSPQRIVAVVGHQAEAVAAAFSSCVAACVGDSGATAETVVQSERLGTGHAVRMAAPTLAHETGTLVVLSGDAPLLRPETLQRLVEMHHAGGFAATVLTTSAADPTGYGRIVRDAAGAFARIVEHRDATPAERDIREINAGIYAFDIRALFPALARLSPANAQGEYYLTDALALLKADGAAVGVFRHDAPEETLGVNSRAELAAAAAVLRRRKLDELMRDGVTILDPTTTYVDADVRVGMDSVLYPNVILEGETVVGENCRISCGAHLVNAKLGDGVTVRDYSMIVDSALDDDVTVGPFAHLRMNARLRVGAVVGNFVEVKKSTLGAGTKAMHLSYLGDATLGDKVNVGAGTITCNYDGKNKHATVIEDGAKIGSDTMLVAPVRVGKNAMTGAGAVVTKDVPDGALAAGVPAVVKKTINGAE
jgi:bifunctional UDP-N-acetylglucosamine pyrophosphorylase / glucosamine-1-phosphate N-acetyltransferase